MGVLINYDLDSRHTDVKNAMYNLGYQNFFTHLKLVDGRWITETIYLPNTTLYHENKTSVEARDTLKYVADTYMANIEHCIAVAFVPDTTEWAGILGIMW